MQLGLLDEADATVAKAAETFGRTEQAAAECIGLQFGNPHGHSLLGAALASREPFEEAVRPLENALRLAPAFLRAQRLLARVYRRLG